MRSTGFSILWGLIIVSLTVGVLLFGKKDAAEAKAATKNISMFLRAQVEERAERLERYQDPEFFEERGNAALSDRMDREIPEFNPEDPFDVLSEGLNAMLLDEGWQVILYDEKIGEKGSGQIVGQMNPAGRIIELTMQDPKQTTLVMFHEVGHIVAAKIRTDLIRAGYTSRKSLPDIVFHGGADTGYHENLYEEYLANYLAESLFWSENARMAGEEFFMTYQTAAKNCIIRNPVGRF